MSDPAEHRRRAHRYLQIAEKIADPARRGKAIELAVKWAARAQQEQRPPAIRQEQVPSDCADC